MAEGRSAGRWAPAPCDRRLPAGRGDLALPIERFPAHVLDEWFENEVKPRLRGKSTLARFADDAVLAFADFQDAKRVLDVLGKRLARYELKLHSDKTRFVDFRSYRPDGKNHPDTAGTTFIFLGFCHVWGKSSK